MKTRKPQKWKKDAKALEKENFIDVKKNSLIFNLPA